MSAEPPAPRTVVGAIIVDSLAQPTRVAAARRTGPPELAGYWEFPGGKLEPGETAHQALARELEEELSIAVRIGAEHSDGGRPWSIGDGLELRLFFVELAAGELAPGPVHDAVTWLGREDVQQLAWLPSDAAAVAALVRALAPADRADRLRALAELIVSDVGVNVQAGQVVAITAQPGMEEVWRAVAAAAYERGAGYVDPWIFDPYVKHARLRRAPEDSLGYRPPWWAERYRGLGALGGAQISLAGQVAPTLMADIAGERLGRDVMPRIPELFELIGSGSVNWTVVPAPCDGWAALVYPDLEPPAGADRLWDAISFAMRLDAPDPAAAWRERFAQLAATAARLNALALDALVFEGPGTNLTVGLLPRSRWRAGYDERSDGLTFGGNLPTEEVYTAPDPLRVHGHVRATKPLVLSGQTVHGLAVRFDHGRAVAITAEQGAELLATMTRADAGAARLGEVALVDAESRIGQLETVFYDTLLDENSASHIALGSAYPDTVDGAESRARINQSSIHIDCMIGSVDVAVTGISRAGKRIPLLRGGAWQLAA